MFGSGEEEWRLSYTADGGHDVVVGEVSLGDASALARIAATVLACFSNSTILNPLLRHLAVSDPHTQIRKISYSTQLTGLFLHIRMCLKCFAFFDDLQHKNELKRRGRINS